MAFRIFASWIKVREGEGCGALLNMRQAQGFIKARLDEKLVAIEWIWSDDFEVMIFHDWSIDPKFWCIFLISKFCANPDEVELWIPGNRSF